MYYEVLHVFFHIALSVFIEEDSMGCSQIERERGLVFYLNIQPRQG